MKRSLVFLVLCFLLSSLSVTAQGSTLTLITHDSFSVSEAVLARFEAETGIKVDVLTLGDTGSLVNQAILSKDAPLGDVLFGVDNTFLSRALEADLFEPYISPELKNVSDSFLLDDQNRVTPVDYGDVCINYDIAYFETNELPLPQSLADLADPMYQNLLVVQNPATSSPGLAFLLATIQVFGEEEAFAYWQALLGNGTLVVDGWETAYFGHFSAVAEGGTYPLVVSYASSPPFTLDEATGIASTASLVFDEMCFRQVEFVGILKGTSKQREARAWVDFMLSDAFQADVPLQMYVFPVREGVQLPEAFEAFAQVPENPVLMDSATIEANRERWIQAWLENVLR
jgi:thiamine transport system substrate-binding protein